MNKTIIKMFIIIFIIFLSINKVYAYDMDEYIEERYYKVETEEGTFYKMKPFDTTQAKITFLSPNSEEDENYNKISKIVTEKTTNYIKSFTTPECPEDKKIEENFTLICNNIYSITKEKPFNEGDDIVALTATYATPVKAESNYWKENFSNNEISYNEIENKYYVTMYYFVRLSKSQDTGEYEIAYIGLKPENYDEYVAELKNTKGIDLNNLDIDKIFNISYKDNIKPVASSNTNSVSGKNEKYNTAQIEEISNISFVIRIICLAILSIFIIICIIRKINIKKNK